MGNPVRLFRNARLVNVWDMRQGREVINALSESDRVTFGGEYGQVILNHAELESLMDFEGEGFEGFLQEAYEEVLLAGKADTEIYFVL